MAFFLNTIFGSLVSICITVLVTLAITLIFKTSYTTNFAQGVISAFGAFMAATLINKAGVSIWLSVPVGIVLATAVAVFIDVVIFRHGRYVNAIGKQIITMGLMSIIIGAIPLVYSITKLERIEFPTFLSQVFTFNVGIDEVAITANAIVCVAITAVIVTAIFVLLKYSKWGLSVRATASNEFVAGMMGINTHIVTAISWGLAGALGALAACMYAGQTPLSSTFMTDYQVNAFLAGILGGFGSFYGPIIAAVIIPLANNLLMWIGGVANSPDLTTWTRVIVYALILLAIFFKPNGLFGKRTAKKV